MLKLFSPADAGLALAATPSAGRNFRTHTSP